MTTVLDEPTPPWHAGERYLQTQVGVDARMAVLGPKVVRSAMPDQHRMFFAQLPALMIGAVDDDGEVWAGVLEGEPGFAVSPEPNRLRVQAMPDAADPLRGGLGIGHSIGLLGIELQTRRRNRMNGRISSMHETGFDVAVAQSFGNCPQYIQTRDFHFSRPPGTSGTFGLSGMPGMAGAMAATRLTHLDDAARLLIRQADTFFVASYADTPQGRAVDVSHRGGRAGFVRVDDDVLTIPDFSGNRFFNTLGNFVANPRAGLVFIDFEHGDLLQITGQAQVILDSPEIALFQGAERLWRVHVSQMVRRPDALALRWRFGEYAPTAVATGTWQAA